MRLVEFESAKVRAGSLSVNAMLAAAGGYLDGFTYVGHWHVFANAMTANVVLFGANCFTGSWQTAHDYLPPIIAFLGAVWASQAIQLHSKRCSANIPYGAVLLLETGVLLILSLLPAHTSSMIFTASIAFAASVQMQTFREVNGRSYASTFTTGNLRTLGEAAFTWCFEGHHWKTAQVVRDFSVIVTAFLLGAIAGGGATKVLGRQALWCDIGLLLVVAARVRGSRQPRNLTRPVAIS